MVYVYGEWCDIIRTRAIFSTVMSSLVGVSPRRIKNGGGFLFTQFLNFPAYAVLLLVGSSYQMSLHLYQRLLL